MRGEEGFVSMRWTLTWPEAWRLAYASKFGENIVAMKPDISFEGREICHRRTLGGRGRRGRRQRVS